MQARRPHRSSHFEVDRALLAAIPILLVASLHLLLPMIARNHKPLAKHESLVSETIVLGAAHDNPDGRPLEDSLAFKQQLKPALIKEDEVAYRELVQLLQRRLLQGVRIIHLDACPCEHEAQSELRLSPSGATVKN